MKGIDPMKISEEIKLTQIYNVGLIGLPIDKNEFGFEIKVGKSFICNRLKSPKYDDQMLNHESIFTEKQFENLSNIIDNKYLFWGSKNFDILNENKNFQINLFEFSYFKTRQVNFDDDLNEIYKKYLSLISQKTYNGKNKIRYICNDQVENPESYPKDILITGDDQNNFSIDIYMIVIDVEDDINYMEEQLAFLVDFYNKIKYQIDKNQTTAFIIASKCDKCEYDDNLNVLKLFLKENQLDLPLIETSSCYNVNIEKCFESLIWVHNYRIEQNNTELLQQQVFDLFQSKFYKIESFKIEFSNVCILMNKCVHEFISLLITHKDDINDNFKNFIEFFKDKTNENLIISKNLDIFGLKKLKRIFKEILFYKYTLVEKWMNKKYIEAFIHVLEHLFVNLNSLSNVSWKWDKCNNYLLELPEFNDYFIKLPQDLTWNSVQRMNNYIYIFILDNDSLSRLFKFKIPIDFLDNNDCKVEFENYVNNLVEKNNERAVAAQLEEQLERMIEEGDFKPFDAIEEVAFHLLFRGYDRLSQAIMEYEFTPIFTKYSDILEEQAKKDFHELLFENVIAIDNLVQNDFKIEDLRNLISYDDRYKKFCSKIPDRIDGWLLNHLASRNRSDICVSNDFKNNFCFICFNNAFNQTFAHNLLPFKLLPNHEFTLDNSINIFVISSKEYFDKLYSVVTKRFNLSQDDQQNDVLYDHIMYYHGYGSVTSSISENEKPYSAIPFRLVWFEKKWANLKHFEQKSIPITYNNFFMFIDDNKSKSNASNLMNFINSFSNTILEKEFDQQQLNFATKRIVNSVSVFRNLRKNDQNVDSNLSDSDNLCNLNNINLDANSDRLKNGHFDLSASLLPSTVLEMISKYFLCFLILI